LLRHDVNEGDLVAGRGANLSDAVAHRTGTNDSDVFDLHPLASF